MHDAVKTHSTEEVVNCIYFKTLKPRQTDTELPIYIYN